MLSHLEIRNVVLIESLSISLSPGLTVLTGETGAGKSILLDALGLALGRRADARLVRGGAERASVAAEFLLDDARMTDLADELADLDISLTPGEPLLLRRMVRRDGTSRAHVNDQPVSVSLLRRIGERLVEVHGQHDERGLLNPAGHRALLDAFAGVAKERAGLERAFARVDELEAEITELQRAADERAEDREWLDHAIEELRALAPEAGEETELADERARLMQAERIAGDLDEVWRRVMSEGGLDDIVRQVLRQLERITSDEVADILSPAFAAFDRAAIEMAEGVEALTRAREQLAFDPARLETVEERLFALRAAARKHQVPVVELPALLERLEARRAMLETGEERLATLQAVREQAEEELRSAAMALRKAREAAARRLDRLVTSELAPLKLGSARFRTRITPLERSQWTAAGSERVAFEVATNPGADFGPLSRIASGGELARFILALKVVLTDRTGAPTLIFDEVDRGIGGATAAAVGERLARLAAGAQVLLVTHSPQVAAHGDHHVFIEKYVPETRVGTGNDADLPIVALRPLDEEERVEELARMLAGAQVTVEAREAARHLLRASQAPARKKEPAR
ncbi:MAG: DNA repair protein RecN [Alphaproteobacteria bacterium]|nr:MAG: DNA repair protein RecN [Alphaproteobacteria bacterium]